MTQPIEQQISIEITGLQQAQKGIKDLNARIKDLEAQFTQASLAPAEFGKQVKAAEKEIKALEATTKRFEESAKKSQASLNAELAKFNALGATAGERLKNRLKAIDAEIENVTAEFNAGRSSIDQYTNSLDRLEKEARQAESALERIEAATPAPVQERRGLFRNPFASETRTAGRRESLKKSALGSFSTTLRDLPAVPIPNAGGLSTEAIARVGQSLAQFGVTFSTLIPIAAGGAAIFFTLKSAFDALAKETEKAARALKAYATVLGFISEGRTSEDAQKRVEELQKQIDLANKVLEEGAKKSAELVKNQWNVIGKAIGDFFKTLLKGILDNTFGFVLKIISGNIGKAFSDSIFGVINRLIGKGTTSGLNKELEEYREAATEAQAEIDALTEAQRNGEFAANDAAAAEEKLAQARTSAALQAADDTARLLRAQIDANTAISDLERQLFTLRTGVEAVNNPIQSRIDSLNVERRVLEAQIRSLQQSGDASADVTQKLEELNRELRLVSAETGIFTEQLPRANAILQQIEAEKRRQEQAEAAKKRAEELAREEERKREERARKLKQELEKIAKVQDDYADALKKARRNLADDIEDIARDLNDNLREAIIDTEKTIEDAIAETNAIAVVEAQKELRREQEELRRRAADAERDARIDYERALRDAFLKLQDDYGQIAIDKEREIYHQRLLAQMGYGSTANAGGTGGVSATSTAPTGGGLTMGVNWEEIFRRRNALIGATSARQDTNSFRMLQNAVQNGSNYQYIQPNFYQTIPPNIPTRGLTDSQLRELIDANNVNIQRQVMQVLGA